MYIYKVTVYVLRFKICNDFGKAIECYPISSSGIPKQQLKSPQPLIKVQPIIYILKIVAFLLSTTQYVTKNARKIEKIKIVRTVLDLPANQHSQSSQTWVEPDCYLKTGEQKQKVPWSMQRLISKCGICKQYINSLFE